MNNQAHDGAPNPFLNGGAGGFNPGSVFSTTIPPTSDDDECDDEGVEPPLFRSVAVQPHFNAVFTAPQRTADPTKAGSYGHEATKSSFQFPGKTNEPKARAGSGENQLKRFKALAHDQMYVLPYYYPTCERRSATIEQDVDDVLDRLFSCFKKMSIQARHESSFATFGLVLRTAEQLELSLLIWYADKARTKLYIEVDKRQSGSGCCGGSSPFKYICRILKAVKSCGHAMEEDALILPQHRELQGGNSNMRKNIQRMELIMGSSTPKVEASDESLEFPKAASPFASFTCVGDQTLNSLEMAWGCLKKPVTWSHGLELLGTVSDAKKSGIETSKVVSRAILLGASPLPHGETCCRGIHEKLVHLMQSLVGDEAEKISTEHLSAYQKDCLLQNVLTCFVNAMEAHVKFATDGSGIDAPLSMPAGSSVMSQFLESTKDVVACDILETLFGIIRRANTKPHHAYLAVKALFLLSSENASMRQYVALAMSKEDNTQPKSCTVLRQAHEVGAQTHGLLEAECERLQGLLRGRH